MKYQFLDCLVKFSYKSSSAWCLWNFVSNESRGSVEVFRDVSTVIDLLDFIALLSQFSHVVFLENHHFI